MSTTTTHVSNEKHVVKKGKSPCSSFAWSVVVPPKMPVTESGLHEVVHVSNAGSSDSGTDTDLGTASRNAGAGITWGPASSRSRTCRCRRRRASCPGAGSRGACACAARSRCAWRRGCARSRAPRCSWRCTACTPPRRGRRWCCSTSCPRCRCATSRTSCCGTCACARASATHSARPRRRARRSRSTARSPSTCTSPGWWRTGLRLVVLNDGTSELWNTSGCELVREINEALGLAGLVVQVGNAKNHVMSHLSIVDTPVEAAEAQMPTPDAVVDITDGVHIV